MYSYLTENQFFAPISTFSAIAKSKNLLIEAHENYQKRGFRNRCIIDSPHGPLTMSIPLSKGKNEKMPVKEVTINFDTDWKRLHLQTIRTSYGSAAYFDHIYPEIEKLYDGHVKYLFDFNFKILNWLIEFMELECEIDCTTNYAKEIINDKIIDVRNHLKSKNYTDVDMTLQPYAQVFAENHSFLANLSIMDLIFCTGKASLTYLS